MTIIDVTDNVRLSLVIPLRRLGVYTGSSALIGIKGMPDEFVGLRVLGVKLSLTNADGASLSVDCEQKDRLWTAMFASSFCSAYGHVSNGMKVEASVDDGEHVHQIVVGVGDFDIVASSADARRGDPDRAFQGKGDDVYLKTEKVEGVQHFTRLECVYNDRIGWGFDRVGDFILVDGEFVEVDA